MTFKERYQYNPKTDLIGRGGFSRVFKAKDILLDRNVALKVFTSETSGKYDLINEIKKVIRLDHPHLCRYYDVALLENTTALGEEEKVQVGVMEYMEAGDLREYYRNHNNSLNELLIGVLKGLSFLHKRGIIHRDLKPQNILVTETDEGPVAKITDFGISKAIDSGNTTSSMLLGTIEYMAPEQFSPEKYGINGKISTNLDLWSFGLMVYNLIKNENVFSGRSGSSSAEHLMSKMFLEDYLHKLDNLPEPYRSVTKKCLVKDASKRIVTPEELIEILSTGIEILNENKVRYNNNETQILKHIVKKKETPILRNIINTHLPKKRLKYLSLIFAIGLSVILLIYILPRQNSKTKDNYLDANIDSIQQTKDSSTINNSKSDTASAIPEHKPFTSVVEIENNLVLVNGSRYIVNHTNTEVNVKDFYISRYEITNGVWNDVSNIKLTSDKCLDCPVVDISWLDVEEFIKKLNNKTGKKYRLPTEAEWEYAAAGGQMSKGFTFSGSDNIEEVAWFDLNAERNIHPVGLKQPNELGLYDMTGNVTEWTNDWYSYDSYPGGFNDKAIRGGSFQSNEAKSKIINRTNATWFYSSPGRGFRLVRDLD